VRAGNIKCYAFTGQKRLATAPDVPTTDEAGLRDFHTSVWVAIWAPKATPAAVIAKLDATVINALADETALQRLADLGQHVVPREQQGSEALRVFHKAEIRKWWPIIKAAGIKAG
jgi:tripartite-type tricarboxylate transporter receptor subunit TctC